MLKKSHLLKTKFVFCEIDVTHSLCPDLCSYFLDRFGNQWDWASRTWVITLDTRLLINTSVHIFFRDLLYHMIWHSCYLIICLFAVCPAVSCSYTHRWKNVKARRSMCSQSADDDGGDRRLSGAEYAQVSDDYAVDTKYLSSLRRHDQFILFISYDVEYYRY